METARIPRFRREYGRAARRHGWISGLLSGTLSSIAAFSWYLLVRSQLWEPFFPVLAAGLLACTGFGLLLYLRLNRKQIRRSRELRRPFPESWRALLLQQVEYYRSLSPAARFRFEQRVQVFLLENKIEGVGWEADLQVKLLIAAGAVIPALALHEWEYQGLGTIFVYPEAFDADYRYGKGAPMAGQVTRAHSFNAMAFSRRHVLNAFLLPPDGRNVVVHEFAHLLDGADGAIDGLMEINWTKEDRERWKNLTPQEQERVRAGRTLIDRYALSSRVEFFAVLSEYFFELPDALACEHPEIYDLLCRGFQQDPRQLLASTGRQARYLELASFRDQYWEQYDQQALASEAFTRPPEQV